MKVYLLWYKESPESKETIVSASRTYEKAEKIAVQLHFERTTIEQEPVYEIGITRTLVNKLCLHIDPEDASWTVFRNDEWDLDDQSLLDGNKDHALFIVESI